MDPLILRTEFQAARGSDLWSMVCCDGTDSTKQMQAKGARHAAI
jgi:hypothetical protein